MQINDFFLLRLTSFNNIAPVAIQFMDLPVSVHQQQQQNGHLLF